MSPARPLKAVLFDIDDTLYSTTEFAETARRNSIRAMIRHGLGIDEESAFRELKEVISEVPSNYDKLYDRLLRRLPASALGNANPAILLAAAVVAYHETKFRELHLFPGAHALLGSLRANTTLVIGVLTEGLEVKQAEKIIRLGIYEFLDPRAIFISDQFAISKVNPKFYRRALDTIGFAPGEVMFVGDNPVTDIEPAKRAGMIAVRRRGTGKHGDLPSAVPPDFEIRHFDELAAILRTDFGLPV
ncbi:MAG: TIGR02253 family HAD-type hydrolase [Planctomycetes bacterium]|nr:TIGR02253 family HAD-type hydrolase [Planctomycetota bacterium]